MGMTSLLGMAVREATKQLIRRGLAMPRYPPPDECAKRRCVLGRCLEEERLCDRVWDCQDGEDELGCDYTKVDTLSNNETVACKTESFLVEASSPRCSCPSGFGKCRSKDICLPKNLFCDGNYDCDDGSDEDDDCNTCLAPIKFFTPQLLCDGKSNCEDSSDEASAECPGCEPNQFRCDVQELGTKPKCVERSSTCDGTSDCEEGADEEASSCMALATVGLVRENKLLMPSNLSTGYLHVRLRGVWFPYCASDWSLEHSRAVCKRLGFGQEASFFLRPRTDAVNLLRKGPAVENPCKIVLLTCNPEQS